jgi:hypothetical protein
MLARTGKVAGTCGRKTMDARIGCGRPSYPVRPEVPKGPLRRGYIADSLDVEIDAFLIGKVNSGEAAHEAVTLAS